MKLMSPKGTEITGTLEIVTGSALFHTPTRAADGRFNFEYGGETELFWDDQRTVTRQNADGKPERVFLDENNEEFLESELTLEADEEENDDAAAEA